MSLTKKKLIELLDAYSEDALITDEQNRSFIHIVNKTNGDIILSTTKPIGYCNRSGEYVYPSIIEGYDGFCAETDEDLYSFEFTKNETKIKNS